jgi:hypothetical protein
VGKPAFELKAFRERISFGGSGWPWRQRAEGAAVAEEHPLEDRKDFPGTIAGLERVLVLPWNERISVEMAERMGESIAAAARRRTR